MESGLSKECVYSHCYIGPKGPAQSDARYLRICALSGKLPSMGVRYLFDNVGVTGALPAGLRYFQRIEAIPRFSGVVAPACDHSAAERKPSRRMGRLR
jgi:hypothetical protein